MKVYCRVIIKKRNQEMVVRVRLNQKLIAIKLNLNLWKFIENLLNVRKVHFRIQ